MTLRNVPKAHTLEQQRQEINLIASDLNTVVDGAQTFGGAKEFTNDVTFDSQVYFGNDLEIGGTPGTPNTKLYASGSAEFAGGVDLTATNVNGSSINTFGGYTVQGSNGLRVVLDGYNQTTNTVRILTDGSATFAGQIYSSGFLADTPNTNSSIVFRGKNTGGSATTTVLADGSATFAGGIDAAFHTAITPAGQTDSTWSALNVFNTSSQLKASIKGNGSATFDGAIIHGQLNAGGTGGNYFSNGEVAAYGPSTSANLWRGWNASGGSNVLTSSISAIGSAMFANDITLDRPTAPSDVKISGSDTHAVWLSDGKFALKYDGTASFAETVTIGSGSAAPDDYGLIAYANANTLSNKSAVYARNLGGGRNFTGDNAAGATTFELYASGLGNFGLASNSTGNNGVAVGGNNGSLNIYTDRYTTDCFQILNTTGSGTNIALQAFGNGKLNVAAGNLRIEDVGDGANSVRITTDPSSSGSGSKLIFNMDNSQDSVTIYNSGLKIGSGGTDRIVLDGSTGNSTFDGRTKTNWFTCDSTGATVAASGTSTLTINGFNPTFVQVYIKVNFSANGALQAHYDYELITCDAQGTGGTTAIRESLNESVGSFQVSTSDFAVTKSGQNIIITYTNQNSGENQISYYVNGLFNSLSLA